MQLNNDNFAVIPEDDYFDAVITAEDQAGAAAEAGAAAGA
jgi:hypothetical protein